MTQADSAAVVSFIRTWMAKANVRSIYELTLLGDIPRATVYRWMSAKSPIPLKGARKMVESIAAHIESDEPLGNFDEFVKGLLCGEAWGSRLRQEMRARNVSIDAAMDAIRAAQLRIVPQRSRPESS